MYNIQPWLRRVQACTSRLKLQNCLCTEQFLIPLFWLVQTGSQGADITNNTRSHPAHCTHWAGLNLCPTQTKSVLRIIGIQSSDYPGPWLSMGLMWTLCPDHPGGDVRQQQQQLERWARWHHYSISPLSIILDEIEIAGPDPNLIRGTQTYSQENRIHWSYICRVAARERSTGAGCELFIKLAQCVGWVGSMKCRHESRVLENIPVVLFVVTCWRSPWFPRWNATTDVESLRAR